MKTEDLIAALARDHTLAPATGRLLLWAMLPAVLLAIVLLLVLAGVRADLGAVATGSLRFNLKLLLTGGLLVTAAGLLLRVARPAASPGRWLRLMWAVPVMLVVAVALELAVLPSSQWHSAAIGNNSVWCLAMIPFLGLAPLAAGLWALRQAAPVQPMLAGAVVGLLSAGIAAFLYALHCTDDSPLFVAIWYSLATALLTLAGAMLGRSLLRW